MPISVWPNEFRDDLHQERPNSLRRAFSARSSIVSIEVADPSQLSNQREDVQSFRMDNQRRTKYDRCQPPALVEKTTAS